MNTLPEIGGAEETVDGSALCYRNSGALDLVGAVLKCGIAPILFFRGRLSCGIARRRICWNRRRCAISAPPAPIP